MEYVLIALVGYLLGTSSMAFYLSIMTKKDVRKSGSGNLGASNTMALLGWKAAVLVGAHDIGKAWLAVLLAKWIFPNVAYAGAVAGVASVIGHIFPFYLKFKGGKGLASYIGLTAGLDSAGAGDCGCGAGHYDSYRLHCAGCTGYGGHRACGQPVLSGVGFGADSVCRHGGYDF